MLTVKNLSKSFPIEGGPFRRQIGKVQALRNISFELLKGETLAVVGGSGCGKSTLAKILSGLLWPDEGEVLWEGTPLLRLSRQDRSRLIQMIFQDPYASLNPKLSVGTQLHEVLRLTSSPLVGEDEGGGAKTAGNPPSQPPSNLCSRSRLGHLDNAQALCPGPDFLPKTGSVGRSRDASDRWSPTRGEGVQERSIKLLENVGLSADTLVHYPFQFSGGQRQRIAIARALALRPQLVIADEPLSALDIMTQSQIIDLFGQLKTLEHLTILFITHDLAVARHFSDRVLVLQDGKIVEEGPTRTVLERPEHPYTQSLLAAIPKIPC